MKIDLTLLTLFIVVSLFLVTLVYKDFDEGTFKRARVIFITFIVWVIVTVVLQLSLIYG